ncbi:DUF5994 family protein, partial [Nocardia gipuzkoensis]
TRNVHHVDGAWWPHSNNLASELPTLFEILTPVLGAIHRVAYPLREWAETPGELVFAGQSVRLHGYRHGAARTIEILGTRGRGFVLLVVPPATTAYQDLTALSEAQRESTTVALPMSDTRARVDRTGRAAALRRWRAD